MQQTEIVGKITAILETKLKNVVTKIEDLL